VAVRSRCRAGGGVEAAAKGFEVRISGEVRVSFCLKRRIACGLLLGPNWPHG